MLTPNFGIEYTLGNKNWNKWTLGISGRINWNTQTKDPTYNVYDLYDGKIELRKYWHGNNKDQQEKNSFYLFQWIL